MENGCLQGEPNYGTSFLDYIVKELIVKKMLISIPFIWRHSTAVYEDILSTPIPETRWLRHIESQNITWIHSNLSRGHKVNKIFFRKFNKKKLGS